MRWKTLILVVICMLVVPIFASALPSIFLYNPYNTTLYDPNVTFNFSVTHDGTYSIQNCSLWLNSSRNQTNTSAITSATPYQFYNYLSSGSYSWNTECAYTVSCLQNLANQSNDCGGVSGGSYLGGVGIGNPERAYDGNISTFAWSYASQFQYVWIYANYTKPSNAASGIVSVYAHTRLDHTGYYGYTTCWNSTNWIPIGPNYYAGGGNYHYTNASIDPSCFNDTNIRLSFSLAEGDSGGTDAIYEMYVFWNITNSSYFNSSDYNFSVDLISKPTITQSPLGISSNTLVNEFYCNTTSNRNLTNVTYTMWNVTDIVNTTYINITGLSYQTGVNLTVPVSGTYTWGCSVYDYLGNYNASNSTITINTAVPAVNTLAPANASYTNNQTPPFIFTSIYAGSATTDCVLFINNTAYGQNATTASGVSTTIVANHSISEGTYDWYVNCTNGTSLQGQSAIRRLYIDTTAPNITTYSLDAILGIAPFAGSIYANCTDNFGVSDIQTSWQILNGTWSSNYSMTLTGSYWTKTYVYPAEHYSDYSFFCTDLAGNKDSRPNTDLVLLVSTTAPVAPSGGGGGSDIAAILGTVSNSTDICGDGVCNPSETTQTCWQDCRVNVDRIFSCVLSKDQTCDWGKNWFPILLVLFIIGIILYVLIYQELIK